MLVHLVGKNNISLYANVVDTVFFNLNGTGKFLAFVSAANCMMPVQ